MTIFRQGFTAPRTQQFHRRHRTCAGRSGGRTRKTIFIPHLTALENRTLLATLVVDPAGGTGVFTTIQAAVNAAAGGDTIQIHPATYTEQVTIGKSLTMMGTGSGATIQAPPTLTPDALGQNVVVEVNNAATVTMSDLTIQGPVPTGITIDAGILVVGGATANVTNSTIAHIRGTPLNNMSGTGFGIQVGGASGGAQVGTATITNDTITDYQKNGILVQGGSSATITGNTIATAGPATNIAQNGIVIRANATATITGNAITGNQYTGPGSGPDPFTTTQAAGIVVFGGASVTGNTVTGNDIGIASSTTTGATISGNTVANSFEGVFLLAGTATVSSNTIDGNNIGVALIAFVGDTANAEGTLVSNNIFNNGKGGLSFPGAGISVLAEAGATTVPSLTANFNRIVGNSVGLNNGTTTPADAPLNWWGSNTGPNTTGSDNVSGSGEVSFSPWLVLGIAASPTTVVLGGTSTVTASVTTDSSGATHPTAPFFPNGIPITFGATGGTITPASVPTQSGTASSSFTSTTAGSSLVSATLDNQTVTLSLVVEPKTSPVVTQITDVNLVAIPFPYEVPLGTSVHDTATILEQVSGVPATGTVTYEFFKTINGTGPHADEVVHLNPDGSVPASALHGPLAAGSYSFIAVYSGDSNYTGSTSDVEPLTVPPTAPAIVTQITDVNLAAIPFPYEVPLGTSVHDTATITGQHPGVPATGTVTYEFFTTINGTGPHNDQTVTLNPDGTVPASTLHGPFAAGEYSFTAVYSGDSNYAGSTSAAEPLTVQQGAFVAPTVMSLQRFGFHAQPTTFVLTFSTALEQATAEDVANYVLKRIEGQHLGPAIPIQSAVYDPTAHTVTLHPTHTVYLFARYHLRVNGSTPTGVTGETGLLLDGKENGQPGSDYVRTFGKEILAGPNDPPGHSRRSLHHQNLPTMTHASSHQPTGSTAASRNQALSAPAVDAILAEVVRTKRHTR